MNDREHGNEYVGFCTNCYKDFSNEWLKESLMKNGLIGGYQIGICPDCNGEVVDMDAFILPAIQELNKKGWKTDYCCSGHLEEGSIGTSIVFKEEIPFSPPIGMRAEISMGRSVIKVGFKDRDLVGQEGLEELKRWNQKILDWAKVLPIKEKIIKMDII